MELFRQWSAEPGWMNSDKRQQVIALAGILVIVLISWVYLIHMASNMAHGGIASAVMSPHTRAWEGPEIITSFLMWFVMMIAMMLPSVSPWVMTLSRMSQKRGRSPFPLAEVSFLAGYLGCWAGYSLLAAGAQWLLQQKALLSPALASTSPVLGAGLLIVAGVFQWTPVRNACVNHCRSPLGTFLSTWKDGIWGAFQMGLRHGLYCVSCCWALMALSFVAGVMNLFWMAILTIYLLLDLVVIKNEWFDRVVGAMLVVFGIWLFL